jgi:hypothetical protein
MMEAAHARAASVAQEAKAEAQKQAAALLAAARVKAGRMTAEAAEMIAMAVSEPFPSVICLSCFD